jgi:amidase
MVETAPFINGDPYQAFVPYPPVRFPEKLGALSGKTFAVKDLFDVEGYPTSFGQPHVLATSGIKTQSAGMVKDLLGQGARFVGKTHMVEMAFALTGRNVHFGTPINPSAPDRLPGGSSSGSAAAVAGGLADIGLATDTLGSIRVPASYCGLYGLRPTHGRLSLEGAKPLASSLDTGGWLTRDPDTLIQLADTFLSGRSLASVRLGVPRALMRHLEPGVAIAFEAFLEKVQPTFGKVMELTFDAQTIDRWVETTRTIQGYEAWQAHGVMIEQFRPALGPGIRERFAYAATLSPESYKAALMAKETLRQEFDHITRDILLILPSAPGPAPLLSSSDEALEVHRTALVRQLAPASLFSRPEASVPALKVNGLPIGISLVGPQGSDLALCQLAQAFAALD